MEKNEQFYYNLELLQNLYLDVYRNANNAYESFNKFEGDAQYIIASNYLTMAHNGYLKILTFITEHNLEHTELLPFTDDFRDYKFQFDEVIVDKDNNTSWLFAAKNKFDDSYKCVFDFVSGTIQQNMNQR